LKKVSVGRLPGQRITLPAAPLPLERHGPCQPAHHESSDRLKAKLLHAANEFLNKAAELEAGVMMVAPPDPSKAETRD
jgi:hypothetical protein